MKGVVHVTPSLSLLRLTGVMLSIGSATVLAAPLEEARKNELTEMLLQDCGSCHGMTLKGGLGPALTPDALTGKPAVYLQQTILEGHPGTPMPPWKSILSLADIDFLVSTLMSGAALKPVPTLKPATMQ